jgi:hypothetical protein
MILTEPESAGNSKKEVGEVWTAIQALQAACSMGKNKI